MLKRLLIFITLVFCFSVNGFSQSYSQQFNELFDKQSPEEEQLKLLQTWEKATPNDAELFVAYYNFYVNKSRKSGIGITTNRDGTFLGGQSTFDEKVLKTALEYINKGIEKFPNRLDMRFGKIFILGENKDYKAFTDEIVKTIDYSNINKNQWTWANDKAVENPQKFMLSAIQDYIVQLYEEGDEYLDNFKLITETVLKYYPNSVENLSNLSIYYLEKSEFDNALVHLLKAEKLAPTDVIVLNNIAQCYEGKKEKQNALKYYELMIKYGNSEVKADAKKKIAKLKS